MPWGSVTYADAGGPAKALATANEKLDQCIEKVDEAERPRYVAIIRHVIEPVLGIVWSYSVKW